MNAPIGHPKTYGTRTVDRPRSGRSESFRGARQTPQARAAPVDAPLGLGARVGAASPGLRSTHGAMLGALLRAPPRKAVRRYVLVELKRADRRMEYDEIVGVISCPGYDHAGKPCARHVGKDPCGAWEWVTDVDGKGNVVGKWERKLAAATPYEVVVAIGGLLEGELLEIVDGQLRLQRRRRAIERLTKAEVWRREDEEIRLMWQTIEVHESRGVYAFE